MRVAEVTAPGGPEVFRLAEWPDPVAGVGQLLVRVRAANINPVDLASRTGFTLGDPLRPPYVLGWDLAGEVVAVGDGVNRYRPGDRVVGMIPWPQLAGAVGAYAEMAVVDPEWLAKVPDGLDFPEAATIPLNALTARQDLDAMALPAGSTVLVTGASGGVGGFAVQLAVRDGHRVLAIASTGDEEWVRGLGATEVFPRDTDPGSIGPVPAVLDAVPLGEPAARAVADGGVLVATRPTPPIDPGRDVRQEFLLVHNDGPMLQGLTDDVAAGRLRTRVARVMPLAEAGDAHRLVEAGGLRGKVVLLP